MINIIEETVLHLKQTGISTFGLLATEGTVFSRAYEKVCNRLGVTCIVPNEDEQRRISSIIYDDIKRNRPVELSEFLEIAASMQKRGCERLILGCTELSLLKKQLPSDTLFVDSLEVLAYRTILACNKTPIGFDASFSKEAIQ